jgi:hypothetical protein
MAYSAQLTTPAPYLVSTPFLQGIANTIQIPVTGGVASLLSNFTLNGDGNLQYTGNHKAKIVVKAKFSFGAEQPSQGDPTSPFDVGPRIVMHGYVQVGDQKSVESLLDHSVYYDAAEWPGIFYTMDVNQEFCFNPGDEVRFYAYYIYVLPPPGPVNPDTFFVTLNQVALSFLINSDREKKECEKERRRERKEKDQVPVPLGAETKIQMPINTAFKAYEFKSDVCGKTLIWVRMNIKEATLFNQGTSLTTIVDNTDWQAWLAVNNGPPGVLIMQTITNQPNISNGNTVWPASLEFLLLADLKKGDLISVNAVLTYVLAPLATPPFVQLVTSGYVSANLTFDIILSPPLVPMGQLIPDKHETVLLPLRGCLDDAKVMPLSGEMKFSEDFEVKGCELVYKGKEAKRFKIRAAMNIARLMLLNADNDLAEITLQGFGMAIGKNGKAYNNGRTATNKYGDLRYFFTWMTNESATNDILLERGDRISILVYTRNITYLNVPTAIGTTIPNLRPKEGSVVVLSGSTSVVIE